MRVYVAGRFTKKEMVQATQALLVKAGHTITYDWTKNDAGGMLGELRLDYLAQCAQADEEGVKSADAILVLHDSTGRGLFVELGMALADRKKLVVVVGGLEGKHPEGCVFYYLSRVRHFCCAERAVDFITKAGEP